MKNNILYTLLISSLFFTSHFVYASDDLDRGWFVGGELGFTDYDLDWSSGAHYNDESYLVSPYFGYKFSKFLAMEGGGMLNIGAGNTFYSGLYATPKLILPLSNRIHLYFKAGVTSMFFFDEENDDNDFDISEESWTGYTPIYGVGVEYQWDIGVTFRFGYNLIDGQLENDDSIRDINNKMDINIHQFNVGAYYQF